MLKKIALLLSILFLILPLSAMCQDAGRAGEQSANMILNQLKSPGSLNQHINNPLMSSDTKMTTYGDTYECSVNKELFPSLTECQQKCPDGSCSKYEGFNAQIEAPATKAFLKVQILPNNTTQDFQIIVYQDSDLNGSFDYNFTPTFKTTSGATTNYASGVCTHGVVVCSPGTWNNCAYYEWEVDGSGHLNLKQVGNDDPGLGTCYCVNNSCGGVLRSNYSQVLDNLGSGAAMVLAAAQNIAISQAKKNLSELSVSFYGQQSSGIAHSHDKVYETGPDATNTSPQTLESAYDTGVLPTDTEIATQSQEPNSYYNLMTTVNSNVGANVSEYTCEIKHNAVLEEDSSDECHGFTTTDISGVKYCLIDSYSKSEDLNGGTTYDWHKWSFNFVKPDAKVRHVYIMWSVDDYIDAMKVNGVSISGRGIIGENSCYDACAAQDSNCGNGKWYHVDVTDYVHSGSNVIKWLWCGVDGVYVKIYAFTDPIPYEYVKVITQNNCNPQSNCRLKEEQVCDWAGHNCVYTVQNYVPTGLNPLPSCRTFTNYFTHTVCADGSQITAQGAEEGGTKVVASGSDMWWVIKRTYTCKTNAKYNPDLTSARAAFGTVNPSTGQYTEKVKSGGTYVSATRKVSLSSFPTKANKCEMACMVVIPGKTDTTAYPEGGNKATETESATTDKYVIKDCVQDDSGNWHCPLGPGEQHYKPDDKECGCINDFAHIVSALQAVDDAAHDIICSSSPPD